MIVSNANVATIEFGDLNILDYTARIEGLAASMAIVEIPPGGVHARSWSNRSDKYYLVTEGSVRFTLNGNEFDLDSGDFCLVKQGQKFSYRNIESELARLVLVHTPRFDLGAEMFDD